MPMVTNQITQIDRDKYQLIDALGKYCDTLRSELHDNEVLLAAVVKTLSEQSDTTRKLSAELERRRNEARPRVVTAPIPASA